jgi:hypothetical protein
MVSLQAAVSRRGPSFALLALAEAGRLDLLLSREVTSEIEERGFYVLPFRRSSLF